MKSVKNFKEQVYDLLFDEVQKFFTEEEMRGFVDSIYDLIVKIESDDDIILGLGMEIVYLLVDEFGKLIDYLDILELRDDILKVKELFYETK